MLPSYEHLGLFRNPFGCVEPERWSSLLVSAIDLDALARRLSEPGFAVVFRGEAGRGKTTHLRSLHARFAELPYTYLGPDASPRTPIPRAAIHFVDEVQRLGWLARRRLFRRAGSLALTSHADLEGELAAAGHRVESIVVRGLSRPRLEQIVARRLAWAARDAAEPAPIEPERLDALLAIHGDDLRAIADALYFDVEARRARRGDPR
ncbi:hypothetical protein ACNOYE_09930 [Nannocystaceae bacterium ST9]